PYFEAWSEVVGAGDCGFVRTGFMHLFPEELAAEVRANVTTHLAIGIDTCVVGPTDVAALVPGALTDDIGAAAYEPRSGYADPSGPSRPGPPASSRTWRGACVPAFHG